MDQRELYQWTGDPAQLFGIQDCYLMGGKAEGMRMLRLSNATGLELSVLPSRCMDIARLSFCGRNLSFLSKTGLVDSRYFAEDGSKGFFRNFFAGFLTTCGLTYMGAACTDMGEKLGLHGTISNTPAEEVCSYVDYSGTRPVLKAFGRVRQAQVFSEHLTLERKIELEAEDASFTITDKIENLGFEPTPLMILYHMNFGYPLLSPSLRMYLPSYHVTARDEAAQKGISKHLSIEEPRDGEQEQVFFHKMRENNGRAGFMLENPELDMAIEVFYPAKVLPELTQWKSMRSGEYVLGLEPGNCHVKGRAAAREDGSLQFLGAGESVTIDIRVNIFSGSQTIAQERTKFQNIISHGKEE